MKRMIFALGLSVLAGTAPLAAQTGGNTSTVIRSFSETSIKPVLDELKIEVQKSFKENNFEVVDLKLANGLYASANQRACVADGRCVGLMLRAIWDANAKYTQQQNEAFVANFNNRYEFTSAGAFSDGRLYIRRYVIADAGISTDTLSHEIRNFQDLAKKFNDEIMAR